jgi:hypothetical protein
MMRLRHLVLHDTIATVLQAYLWTLTATTTHMRWILRVLPVKWHLLNTVDADESEWEKIRTIKPTSALKGEDYGDCDWNGYAWDIKTTPYNSGHVLVMTSKLMSDKIDGYVLMVGSKGTYECRGCISHARVLKGIREGRYRMKSRNTYWVMQSDLMPLPSKPKPAGFDDYTKDQIAKLRKHYDR